MAGELGRLNILLGLNTAELTDGLSKSEYELRRFTDRFARQAGRVAGVWAGVTAGLTQKLMEWPKQATEALERIYTDLADIGVEAMRAGLPVRAFQELAYAGQAAHVSIAALGSGVRRLAGHLQLAASGAREQARLFQAMGITVQDARGQLRPMHEVMREVADVFAKLPDGATKSALAWNLFRTAGVELIPMLNEGGVALRAAGREAERFGLLVGEDAVRAAQHFHHDLARLKNQARALAQRLAVALLPTLTKWVNQLVALTEAFCAARQATGSFWGAMSVMLAQDPSKSLPQNIQAITQRLAELKKQKAELDAMTGLKRWWEGDDRATLNWQIAKNEEALNSLHALVKQKQALKSATVPTLPKSVHNRPAPDAGLAHRLQGALFPRVEANRIEQAVKSLDQYIKRLYAEAAGLKQSAIARETAVRLLDLEAAGLSKNSRQYRAARQQLEAALQTQARAAFQNRLNNWRDSQSQALAQLRFEIELIGKTRAEIAQLSAARQIDLQVREALVQAQKTGLDLNRQEVDQLTQQADAFKAQANLLEAVKTDRQALVDLFSGMERAAHDAFMNLFESGRSVFQRLADMLKASVLELLYQLTWKRWIIQLQAEFLGGGLSGLLGALGHFLGGFSSSIAAAIANATGGDVLEPVQSLFRRG